MRLLDFQDGLCFCYESQEGYNLMNNWILVEQKDCDQFCMVFVEFWRPADCLDSSGEEAFWSS